MAIIRFLLAISVVLTHLQWFAPNTFNYIILPGLVAVQSFFIISGFYMSLIINEKYSKTKHPYQLYITNRFLRIYPIYWIVLLLTFGYELIYNNGFHISFNHSSLINVLYFIHNIIQNITIIVTPDAFIYYKPIYFLLISQSWSLIVEVTFYLIAPFIARKNLGILLLLFILSIILRLLVWHSNLYPTDWTADYFFPANFIFFILGLLAYRLKSSLVYNKIPVYIKATALLLFLLFTLSFTFIPELHHNIKEWIYYLLLTAMIPLLFSIDPFTKLKLLGDISYPIYISHFLMLYLIKSIFKEASFFQYLIGIIVFALLLHYIIAKPIDNIRTIRYKKDKSEDFE